MGTIVARLLNGSPVLRVAGLQRKVCSRVIGAYAIWELRH